MASVRKAVKRPAERPLLEELEPRILYSADPLAILPDAAGLLPGATQSSPTVLAAALADPAAAQAQVVAVEHLSPAPIEIAFVDVSLPDAQELIKDLQSQAAAGQQAHQLEVVLLDPAQDGVKQITAALAGRSNIAAMHLLTHGSETGLQVGSTWLDADTLGRYAADVAQWSKALNPGADLMLYGCDLAAGQQGRQLISDLNLLTGADVAASTDRTGAAYLGGDWTLEYQLGTITTQLDLSALQQWNHVLATLTLRDGLNGYTDTTDTYLNLLSPAANNSTATTLSAGRDLSYNPYQTLIKFENLVGAGANQIPLGSTITSATLTVYMTSNPTFTNPTYSLYRMLTSWTDTDTYSSMGSGVDGSEYRSIADGTITDSGNKSYTFSSNAAMIATLQGWVNSPSTNQGWYIFCNDVSSTAQFASAENGTVANRPTLTVTYSGPTAATLDLDANNSSGAIGSAYFGSFAENGAAVRIADTDATITAGSATSLTGMTVTISNLLDGAAESLAATTSGTSITASYSSGTGVLTLSGTDTIANYRTVLRSITYNNTSDTPSTTARTINVVGTDTNGLSTATATATISVTATNDAPTATITPATYSATEQTALALQGTGLSIADPDAASSIVQATLSVASGTLTVAAGTTGVLVGGSGTASVTLSGTLVQINNLLAGNLSGTISYLNSSNTPTSDTLTLLASDLGNSGSGGTLTGSDTATINISAVNDAPTATITPVSYSATEQTALTLQGTGLSIADVDAASSSVQATLAVVSGTLTVSAGTTGVTVSGSGSSSVTLTGTITQINNLLAGGLSATVSYTINSNTPPASDTLTLTANDQGNTGSGGALTGSDTATINISAVNDAPTATITPTTYSATEQTALTLQGTGLSIADVDAAGSNVQATVSVVSGTLTVAAGTTGVTVGGSGTNTVTLSGTLTQINNLLAGNLSGTLSYTINSDTPPASDTLTLTANDLGNTGSGGARTGSDTATINISAVNDAPTATIIPATYGATEQVALALQGTGLSIADVDAAGSTVQATVSVVSGTLTAAAGTTGVTVGGSGTNTVTLSGTLTQINNLLAGNLSGTLSYTINSDTPPASDTLTLTANDLGNTGSGGAKTGSDTATINITAVNDAPVISSGGGGASASVNVRETLTAVTTVTATDPEGSSLTYSISGGVDAAKFSVNSSTGALTFVSAPDYESPTDVGGNNVYDVIVMVSDGSLTDTQAIAVTVTDVASTLVVTTTADTNDSGLGSSFTAEQLNAVNGGGDGKVSLREALIAANTTAGANTITFNIASGSTGTGSDSGAYVITLASALPTITGTVTIDASTQSGYVAGGLHTVVLDGNDAAAYGLDLNNAADGSTVRGLVIRNFTAYGVYVESGSDGNTIAGNFIGSFYADGSNAGVGKGNTSAGIVSYGANTLIGGTTAGDRNVISGNTGGYNVYLATGADGTTIKGNYIGTNAAGTSIFSSTNPDYGIMVENSATNITIGGTAAGAGNVVSGHNREGMWITTGGTVTIQGNYIGTDYTGAVDLGNTRYGIYLDDAGTATIGGTTAGAGNVISGNNLGGIYAANAGVTVQGNTIGLNAAGTAALGNTGAGIELRTTAASTIGGNTSAARNIISGNSSYGLDLETSYAHVIKGNYIGVAANGSTLIGNGAAGVYVSTSNQTIGGKSSGDGNVIAGNSGAGIAVASGTNNLYYRNSIYSNGGLGIDLGNDGVTVNDYNDTDGGANYLNNFPVITSVVNNGSNTIVTGSLDWYPIATTSYIEFFVSASKDASGYGEGQTYLGYVQVTTDATTGDAAFSVTLPSVAAGNWITAVSNMEGGAPGGSEFSASVQVVTAANAPVGKAIWNVNDHFYQDYADWSAGGFSQTGLTGVNLGDDLSMIASAEAPTRKEIITIGSADVSGKVYAQIWSGGTWSSTLALPVATPGGTAALYDSFAVAYESKSGDAMLVWDNGDTGTAGLSYAVWNGSAWSAINTIAAPVSGEPAHMKLAADPSSDAMTLVVQTTAGSNNQYAVVWNGSSWGNAQTLGTNTSKQYFEANVAYEHNSGHALVFYDNSASDSSSLQYRVWDGSSWGGEQTVAAPGGVGATNDVYSTAVATDPTSNRIALAVKTSANELWSAVWDGSSWGSQQLDTTSGVALADNHPTMSLAFETQSGDLLLAYGKSSGPNVYYRTWTSGGGWSAENTGPSMGGTDIPYIVKLYADPYSNTVMMGVQDDHDVLNFVTWNGSSWGTVTQLDSNTNFNYRENFTFVWYLSQTAVSNLAGDTLVYLEGQAATVIDQGTAAGAVQGDGNSYSGGNLTVSFNAGSTSSEDVLAIRNQGVGAGQIGVSGSNVSYGGVTIGSYAGGSSGANLVITFNASATDAAVSALLGNITYQNTNNAAPSTSARTVRFVVTDGLGFGSGAIDTTVTVGAVNDTPTATITPATYSATEQVSLTLQGTGLAIADIDAGSSSVQATLSVVSGSLSAAAGSTGVTIGGSGTSTVTLTGTLTQINNLLAGSGGATLSYVINSNTPPASDTLTLTASDLGNTGSGGTLTASDTATINITAVNDAPTAAITPATYSATEQVSLTLHGTGLAIADADAGSSTVQATLSVTSGVLTVAAGTTGVTVSNSGTATVTLSGTLTQINDLLAGNGGATASYLNSSDTPAASATLTLSVSDLGNTGSGGTLTGSDTATINISAVNDAPTTTITRPSYTATEATSLPLAGTGLSVADADAGSTGIQVTLSVALGTLTVSAGSTGVTVGGSGSGSVTLSGTLTQINNLLAGSGGATIGYINDSVTPLAADTLTLGVSDLGNTGSGGAQTASSNVTINIVATTSIDVLAVPGVARSGLGAVYEFNAAAGLGEDSSGNGNTMTLTGGAAQTTDRNGASSAVALSGGDHGEIVGLQTGGAMTISAWVRFDSTGNWQRVIDFGDTNATNIEDIAIARAVGTDQLTFVIQRSDGGAPFADYCTSAAGAIVNGAWMHVAATVDGSGLMSLYINGSLAATLQSQAPTVAVRPHNYVGGSNFASDAAFDGAIDSLVVVNQAMSAQQIATLYQQSNGFNIYEHAGNGTVVGTVVGADPTAATTVTYSLVNSAGGRFAIDSNTGVITVADGSQLNYINATSHNITVRATDGGGLSRDTVYAVHLANVNDAPLGSSGTVTAAEDTPYVFGTADFGFADSNDLVPNALLAVKITTLPGVGSLTLNGAAVSAGQVVLASDISAGKLVFTAAAPDANGTAYDSFTFQVQDDGGTANGGVDLDATPRTLTIDVSAVNDAPTATITPPTYSATEQTALTLQGTGLAIADVDAGSSSVQATLAVTSGTLTVAAGSTGVTVGGSGTNSITLSGTLTQINNLLAGNGGATLSYLINSDTPPASDTLTLTASDLGNTGSGGTLTASDTATINITAVNDAPTATITPPTYSATEQTALTLQGTGLAIADVDAGSSSVQATLAVTSGTLTVAAGSTGVTVGGSGTNSITLSGTLTQINNLLAGNGGATISYLINSDTPPASDTLTLTASDLGNTGSGGTLTASDTATINITAVNDAPTATITPPTYSATEQTVLTLQGTGLAIADVDAGSSSVQATLAVTSGTLTVAAGSTGVTVGGSGTNSVTLTGTLTQINDLLAGNGGATLSYVISSDAPPASDTLTLTASDLGNTGSGGTLTASDTATINISAVNDAPTATITPPSYSATEQTALTLQGTGLAIADVDAGSSSVQATLAVTSGTLTVAAGSTGVTVGGSGTNSITLSGTLAQINNLLAGNGGATISYLINSDTPPASDTLTLTASDLGNTGSGGTLTASDTATINITAVNDAPVVTIAVPSYSSAGQQTLTLQGTGLSVADADAGAATLQLTLSVVNGVLNASAGTSGVTVGGSGSNTLTLSGTLTQINDLLAGNGGATLDYIDNNAAPPATDTLTLLLDDQGNSGAGGALTNSSAVTINMSPAFTVDLDANDSSGATGADFRRTWTEGGGPVTVADADALVTYGQNVSSMVLDLYGAADGSNESLSWSTAGTSISAVYSFDSNTNTFHLVFTGTDTALHYQNVLRSVQYDNASPDPTAGDRTLLVLLGGAGADLSNAGTVATSTITVAPVNNAPTVTVPGSSYSATEQVGLSLHATGLAVADADAGSSTVQATLSVVSGTLSVGAGSTGVTVGGSGGISVTLSGTLVQINALLSGTGGASITYLINSDTPPASDTLTLALNDLGNSGSGGALSGSASTTINITAVNDVPVASIAAGSYTTTEQTPLALQGTGLSIADVDAGGSGVQATLSAGSGTLNVAAGSTGVTVGGSGTGSVTLSGTLAQINNLLAGNGGAVVSYINNSDAPAATDTLTLALDDLGNTGSGGAQTGSASVTINITPVNDAPSVTITQPSYTVAEQIAYGLQGTGLAIGDADAGSAGVQATLSVVSGSLWVTAGSSGAVVSGSGSASVTLTGTVAQINDLLAGNGGSLVSYLINSDTPPASDTLTLAVNDLGNTGGGALAASGSVAINITAINDSPVLAADSGASVTQGQSVVITNTMLALTDVDNSAAQLVYTLVGVPAHGSLTLNSVALTSGQSFTQADVDAGLLAYTNDGSAHAADSFVFSVSDGAGGDIGGNALFALSVNQLPTLSTGSFQALSGAAIAVPASALQASDAESAAGQLVFTLTALPTNGTLMLSGAVLGMGQSFTQADVDAGLLVYTSSASYLMGPDAFSVTLSDSNGGSVGASSVGISVLPLVGGSQTGTPVVVTPPTAPTDPGPTKQTPTDQADKPEASHGGAQSTPIAEHPAIESPALEVDAAKGRGTYTQMHIKSGASRPDDHQRRKWSQTQELARLIDPKLEMDGAGPLDVGGVKITVKGLGSADFSSKAPSVAAADVNWGSDGTQAGFGIPVLSVRLAGTALSVGAVLWASRISALLASLLTSAPAWRSIDPLPILGRTSRSDESGALDDEDEESSEHERRAADMFEGPQQPAGRHAAWSTNDIR